MSDPRLDEEELQAYVDGTLPPGRRATVEAYLHLHPDVAKRVEEYRRQNQLLRAALDPLLGEPVPAHLRVRPKGLRAGTWLRYGGFAASLLLAAVLGWALRGEAPTRADFATHLAQRAALAHLVYAPEVLHPVEVGALQEEHLVGWLSKRLGVPVRAPHLAASGFHLVGGRLLPGQDGPAAQFMYEDPQGRRLTLYVAAHNDAERGTAFRYTEADGISTFYWIDGALGYALSGDLGRERLLQVAEAVYKELTR